MWFFQSLWIHFIFVSGFETPASWVQIHTPRQEKVRHELRLCRSFSGAKKWIRSTSISSKKIEEEEAPRTFFKRREQGGWQKKRGQSRWNPVRLCRRPPPRLRRLFDIRYSKESQHLRVVLLMSGSVQIEQGEAPAILHRGLPTRFYVDLTPCYVQKTWTRDQWTFEDTRVTQMRIGRHTKETVRVVFALGRVMRYQVSILTAPLRVVIDFSHSSLPPRPSSKMSLPRLRPKVQEPPRSPRNGGGENGATQAEDPKRKAEDYVLRYRGALQLPFPYKIQRIAIDAGHGGLEEGAVGRKTRLQEKVVTLDLAKRVIALLREKTSVDVFLTREEDKTISLEQRAKMVKQKQADLLVSIHINSSTDRRLQGLATYFLDWDERLSAAQMLASNPLLARENQGVDPARFRDVNLILSGLQIQTNSVISRILGVAIQRQMVSHVRHRIPQAKDLGVRKGLFYLLFASEVPSVLVEASFLSHPQEEKWLGLPSYRQGIAEGISQGLVDFVQMAEKSQATTRPKKETSKLPHDGTQTPTKTTIP